MPRTNINYSNTVIYKIVCNDLNVIDFYVGHTTDFKRRKSEHSKNCGTTISKNYYMKIYVAIRNNGGFKNWSMIEIEKYPCIDGNEAKKRERYWIESLSPSLNFQMPTRTNKEYRVVFKDKIKEHYELTKDARNEKKREYRILNKDKIKQYNDSTKDKRKENYEQNKEQRAERNKIYRELNKVKLRQIQNEVLSCVCGNTYTRGNKNQHLRSKKHCEFIENKN